MHKKVILLGGAVLVVAAGAWAYSQYSVEFGKFFAAEPSQSIRPAITVLKPNGGETFVQPALGVLKIKVSWRRNWMPVQAGGKVDIFYTSDGINHILARNVPDSSTTVNWPAGVVGHNFKIVVTSRGSGDSATAPLSDSSDGTFSVIPVTSGCTKEDPCGVPPPVDLIP